MLKGMFVKVSTKPSQKYYINKKAGKKKKKKKLIPQAKR